MRNEQVRHKRRPYTERGHMDSNDFSQRVVLSNIGRRTFFKVTLGVAGFPKRDSKASSTKHLIAWVNGTAAVALPRDELEEDAVLGSTYFIRGRSWSSLPLHFAVPPTGLDTGMPMRISAVWVRLKASAGAKIVGVALHDCETTVARVDGLEVHRGEWGDVRIALEPAREVVRTIGVTLDCEFSDVEREISISAVGCEFDLA